VAKTLADPMRRAVFERIRARGGDGHRLKGSRVSQRRSRSISGVLRHAGLVSELRDGPAQLLVRRAQRAWAADRPARALLGPRRRCDHTYGGRRLRRRRHTKLA